MSHHLDIERDLSAALEASGAHCRFSKGESSGDGSRKPAAFSKSWRMNIMKLSERSGSHTSKHHSRHFTRLVTALRSPAIEGQLPACG